MTMRNYCALFLFLLTLIPLTEAAEQWVFLKDGRVCFTAKSSMPFTGVLPDGAEITFAQSDIQGTRTPAQTMQAVDAMLSEMAQGKNIEEHASRLKVLRAAAVPALLKHLENDPSTGQLCALCGLQYCWSHDAFEPVLKKFRDNDANISYASICALEQNVAAPVLAERLKEYADDPDSKRAALVFRIVEPYYPDATLKRISRLLTTPAGRSTAAPLLSRYFGQVLTPNVLELLASKKIEEQRAASVALIVECARQDKPRELMGRILGGADLESRQLAAEFFARLGMPEDLPLMNTAVLKESDMYVLSALKAAVFAVKLRRAGLNALPLGRSAHWKDLNDTKSIHEKLAKCLEILNEHPAQGDFETAWSVSQLCDQCELPHRYGATESALEHESSELSFLRVSIERLLQMAPCGALEEVNDGANAPDVTGQQNAAHFVPPISGYYDAKRKSFGFLVPAAMRAFSNSVHIGDDCGWTRELRTVVCIGNGVVRRVGFIPSWGHIVIIEHRMMDGTHVCSLYAHMSSFIYVKPDDNVEAGQKIGTIGRNQSLENGGYGSHLHFGIHQGAFAPAHWISGYIRPLDFASGNHNWLDPQKFLQENQ